MASGCDSCLAQHMSTCMAVAWHLPTQHACNASAAFAEYLSAAGSMQEADSGASGYEHTVRTIDSTQNPSQAADADLGTTGNLEGLSKLQEPEHVSCESKLPDLSSPRPAQAA